MEPTAVDAARQESGLHSEPPDMPAGRGRRALESSAHIDVAGELSRASSFWPTYRAWRLRMLALPLSRSEELWIERAARAMARCLDLDRETAIQHARRGVLLLRDKAFHDLLVLDLDARRLGELLDSVAVEGMDHLEALPRGEGAVLLSLHYSLYSSLLWLWLARATAQGAFDHLTIICLPGAYGASGLPRSRIEELESAGLGRRSTTAVFDAGTSHPGALRGLVARLRSGGAVLVLADADVLAVGCAGAMVVSVGMERVGFPRGAPWLARAARCSLLPVSIRPTGDSHAVVFGPPSRPTDGLGECVGDHPPLQGLVDQALSTDPAPWLSWQWMPGAQSVDVSHTRSNPSGASYKAESPREGTRKG